MVRDGHNQGGINMELTFADKNTEMIYKKKFSKKIPHQIQKTAYKKLALLDEADSVSDLKAIPSNRLEFLKGSMKGGKKNKYSIRVNKQYRILFEYIADMFCNVELVDYHI